MGIPINTLWRRPRLLANRLSYRLALARPSKEAPAFRVALTRFLDWLLEAHRAVSGRGFSTHYSLSDGWGPPYPETSGYLVPTLLRTRALGHRVGELDAALESTGRWLLEIQYPDGAFDAPGTGTPMVFDTGQVLYGLLALSKGNDGAAYLDAARRAGEWLVALQDKDGAWVRCAYRGIPHTYYSRVSWALAALGETTGDERFGTAARKQLEWVRRQQAADGWFARCSFYPDDRPVLHVIAYTIEGLWESALLLKDKEMEARATGAAEALLHIEGMSGRLASHFGPGWAPSGRSVCVTGLAQMSLIWLRMARRYGRPELEKAAERCLGFLLRHQIRDPRRPQVHGALPGSIPLWGEYFPWGFPNWGAKFLIDALLVAESLPDDSMAAG